MIHVAATDMPPHEHVVHETGREATMRGLAVIGFIALVAFGIWLAVYSSRYVPTALDRVGGAAAALSSFFAPAPASLSVVPATSTAIFTEQSTTTLASLSPTEVEVIEPTVAEPVTAPPAAAAAAPQPGPATSAVYPPAAVTPTATAPYGLPDITTTITAVGYLSSTSTATFTASTTVPAGMRPAVKFTVQNIGTNVVASGWHFSAAIPTQNAFVFYSPAEEALLPGDRIEFTLGFDQASAGVNKSISINADSDQRISESNEGNNGATVQVTIR